MATKSVPALGLCVLPMLQHGVPTSATMETMLQDVEDQLDDNEKQLEECMSALLKLTNQTQASTQFTEPADAVNFIAETRLLDKAVCYDTEAKEITRILTYVIERLEQNQGDEVELLQSLLMMSSKEGLSLPIRNTKQGHMDVSTLSINTATDSAEQNNEALWNEICIRFRKRFVRKLQTLPLKPTSHSKEKRLQYLQSLCTLFTDSDVWIKYRSIRQHQVDKILSSGGLQGNPEMTSFAVTSKNFPEAVALLPAMISEDFEMFSTGVFPSQPSIFTALHDMYLDKLSDHVADMADCLQDELYSMTRAESMNMLNSTGKSHKGHFMFKRGMSRSADNLASEPSPKKQEFTNLHDLPFPHINGLNAVVKSLLTIESHIEFLFNSTKWQVSGTLKRKPVPRAHLRSAMKGSRDAMLAKKFSPKSVAQMKKDQASLHQGQPEGADSTHGVLQKYASQEERPLWNWRNLFSKLATEIARGIEVRIRAAAERSMCTVPEKVIAGLRESAAVPKELVGGRMDYPKSVSKGILELLTSLDELVPLIKAASQGALLSVRTSFVETSSAILRNYHSALNKLYGGHRASVPPKDLLMALSTAVYIRNHIHFYDGVLSSEENSKRSFSILYRQYQDLCDTVSQQIVQRNIHLLSSSLLQDLESHNWQDTKDFFEGERCSFCIQMWSLQMTALRHDLWRACPPRMAQIMYTNVLQESMSLLSARYCKVKPSYRRTPQFRLDVTTMLVCMSEMLYAACGGVGQYLNPSMSEQPHFTIHNSCSSLLMALAVVGAPLDVLYKIYKRGFSDTRRSDNATFEGDRKGYPGHWLPWIRPGLLKQGQQCFDDMQATNALYIQLQLMAAQPCINYGLLLQALLMKDYTLPIMLLAELAQPSAAPCGRASESREAQLEILTSFFEVFLQCDSFPGALAQVILPVIERSGTWGVFDAQQHLGPSNQWPLWLVSLQRIVMSYLSRVLEPAVRIMLHPSEHALRQVEPLSAMLDELPCGCEPQANTDDGSESVMGKDPHALALYSVLSQLLEDMYALPTPIVMFLKAANEQLPSKHVTAPHGSAAIKVLAVFLRSCLLDPTHRTRICNSQLHQEVARRLTQFADSLYCVLTGLPPGAGMSMPKSASVFLKANRNWILELTETVADHFCADLFTLPEVHPLEGASIEFTEKLMTSLVINILNSPKGHENLVRVNHFLMNNHPWVLQRLDIPPLLPSKDTAQGAPFIVSHAPQEQHNFNPLTAFNRIGLSKLDHDAMDKFPWDWSAMLNSDLGMTEAGFRTLLSHRYELQEGAVLKDGEKKPAHVLRCRFDLEAAELA